MTRRIASLTDLRGLLAEAAGHDTVSDTTDADPSAAPSPLDAVMAQLIAVRQQVDAVLLQLDVLHASGRSAPSHELQASVPFERIRPPVFGDRMGNSEPDAPPR